MPGAKTRLTEIDVKEVSLVDAAANKRTFPVVKSAAGAAPPAESAKAEGDAPAPAEAPAAGEPAAEAPAAPAAKAAPAHEALLMERLAAARSGIDKIESGLGTLTKRELSDLVWATQDMLWGVEGQMAVVALSKSAGGVGVPVSETAKSAVAKERGRFNAIAEKAGVDLAEPPAPGGDAPAQADASEPAAPTDKAEGDADKSAGYPKRKASEAEAAALVALMGGDRAAAARAVLDVSDEAIQAAGSGGEKAKADPMTMGAQALAEIAGHLGAMRVLMEADAAEDAAEDAQPAQMNAPTKAAESAATQAAPPADVSKAVADALAPVLKAVGVLQAQVAKRDKSPGAPLSASAEGAAPVAKSKVIWADDMAAAALGKG